MAEAAAGTGEPEEPQNQTAEALSGLRQALRALVPHLSEADSVDLTTLSTALDRIESRALRGGMASLAPPPGDDPARLDRLIELAGPREAGELLRRIRTDLLGAAHQIESALAAPDHLAIRNATHVLIAVAGSVGALRLEAQSRALNSAAHDQVPADALMLLARPALDSLQRLTRCIAQMPEAQP